MKANLSEKLNFKGIYKLENGMSAKAKKCANALYSGLSKQKQINDLDCMGVDLYIKSPTKNKRNAVDVFFVDSWSGTIASVNNKNKVHVVYNPKDNQAKGISQILDYANSILKGNTHPYRY